MTFMLDSYLNRLIRVEYKDVVVTGALMAYSLSSRKPHIPMLLVLRDLNGDWIIMRYWEKISEAEK